MVTDKDKGAYEEDFVPKTAKRRINKTLLIVVALVVVFAGLGFGGYSIYDGSFYYQTENARVDTMIYQLTANASGKLIKMDAYQGAEVKAGQVLAQVSNGPNILSPIDGMVTSVNLQKGDYATASDVLVVVAKTSDIYITANVEETNILKIHPGQTVTVSLDAYGRSFDGIVQNVSTITSTKLTGSVSSFTTSGTYTKVTQLIPIKIKLLDDIDLAGIIGTNATVKIRIK